MMEERRPPMNMYRSPYTRLVLAIASIAMALVLAPAHALAQTDGEISGTVINGATGQPVVNATVTLSKFTSQSPESVDITTEASAEGRYTFEGVDSSDGIVYATSVEYAGVLYGSGMIRVSQDPVAVADITVYETTTEASSIRFRDRVILLNGTNQEIGEASVTDIFNIENTGDRTLIRDETGRTLRLNVPDSASRVTPRPGFDFGTPSVEGSSVYLTSPVRPGTSTPSLTYAVPYRGESIDLDLSAAYPTDSLRFLIPVDDAGESPSIESTSIDLRDDGVTTIGDRDYHVWSVSDISRSTVVNVTIDGLPRSAVGNRELWSAEPLVIVGAFAALASLVTAVVVRRRRLYLPRPVTITPALGMTLEARREELAGELRRLEAERDDARIDETAYHSSRRSILEELRSISRSMRGLGADD